MLAVARHPSNSQLRIFSVAWLAFWVAVGFWLRRQNLAEASTLAAWGMGGGGAALGLLAPKAMHGPYLGLTYATYPIGLLVSFTILAVVFFVVLTPMALWLRVRGRDPLEKAFDRSAKSYWRKHSPSALDRYFKLY